MLILFFFIAVIPFALTGIIVQVGHFSGVRSGLRERFYALTILISGILFYTPLFTNEHFYVLWLFWAGLFLSIAYFVARKHRDELQTNPISRLLGGLFLLAVLIGCFIILYNKR
jgi:phosphoglycerol transferase MdoB-like AlkP superfamily enzyme